MTRRDERVVDNPDVDFEPSDLNVKVIAWVALGLFLFLVITPLALVALYPRADRDVVRTLAVKPPSPVLQIHAVVDLAKFRAAQNEELDSYGWIDRAHGTVHIPIDQAMRDIVRRGIPDFSKLPSP